MLLTVLLAVPLAAATAVSTLLSMAVPDAEQVAAHELGAAQFRVVIPGATQSTLEQTLDHNAALLAPALPPGEHAEPEVRFPLGLSANDRLVLTAGHGMNSSSPLHDGRFRLMSGRFPDKPGEVAISEAAAQRLGVDVDEVVRGTGTGTHTVELRVVGLFRDTFATDRLIGIVPVESAIELAPADMGRVTVAWLTNALSGPVDGQLGITARSSVRPFVDGNAAAVGSFALAVLAALFALIVIVAGVGFALIAAENRREIGQLASVGAAQRQRQCSLTANGLVIGLMASLAGTTAGVAVAAFVAPTISAQFNQDWGSLRLDLPQLIVIMIVGIASTSAAAWVTGYRVSRMPALDALRLRPEPAKISSISRHWIAGSLVVVLIAATGAFLTRSLGLALLAAVAALAAATAGILAWSPWINARAANLTVAPRLALRLHLAAPGRAAAITTVIAAVTATTGIILNGLGGLTSRAIESYVPAVPDGVTVIEVYSQLPEPIVAAVSAELGAHTHVEMTYATRDPLLPYLAFQRGRDPASPKFARVVTADGLETLLGIKLSDEHRAAFEQGTVVTTDPTLIVDSSVYIYSSPHRPAGLGAEEDSAEPVRMSAVVVAAAAGYSSFPEVFLSPSGAAAAGYQRSDQATYYLLANATPTLRQEDAARAVLAGSTNGAILMIERGAPAARGAATVYTATAAALVLMILLISAISVALAGGELRSELGTLASVGAHRQFRRRLSASLGAVTSALGIATGLLVIAVVTGAQLRAMEIEFTSTPLLVLGVCGAFAIALSTAVGYVMSPRPAALAKRVD